MVGEAIRARSIRILTVTTILFVLIGVFRAALDRARAQKAAAEARAQVKALQAQINPHFYFNTLNTIYALIPVDPAAQRTVGLLADMSRHAFASAQSDLVPLAQELDFANAYLEIEKVRLGNRLQCEMPDAALENVSIKLDPAQIQALRKIATMKSIPYQTLIRQWMAEGIRRELNLDDPARAR